MVDLAGIEPAILSCEDSGIPLTYRPRSFFFLLKFFLLLLFFLHFLFSWWTRGESLPAIGSPTSVGVQAGNPVTPSGPEEIRTLSLFYAIETRYHCATGPNNNLIIHKSFLCFYPRITVFPIIRFDIVFFSRKSNPTA